MKELSLILLLAFTTHTLLPLDGDTVNNSTEKISLALIGAGALLHFCIPSAFKATLVVKKQEYDIQLSHILMYVGWMGICLGAVQKFGTKPSQGESYQARGLFGRWLSKS